MISLEDLGHIRELAWVLPAEKLGSAQDIIAAGTPTPRQWVTIYEQAANAANCATDAIEILYDHRKSRTEANAETVYRMIARIIQDLNKDVDEIGGVLFLQRVGKIINTRNKSMHRASVLSEVGNQKIATQALNDAQQYVRLVRLGLRSVCRLDENGIPIRNQ